MPDCRGDCSGPKQQPPKRFRRTALRVLEDAFDNAAHSVAVGTEVNTHYGEPQPSGRENLVSWIRGFIGGLIGDFNSKPVMERLFGLPRPGNPRSEER